MIVFNLDHLIKASINYSTNSVMLIFDDIAQENIKFANIEQAEACLIELHNKLDRVILIKGEE